MICTCLTDTRCPTHSPESSGIRRDNAVHSGFRPRVWPPTWAAGVVLWADMRKMNSPHIDRFEPKEVPDDWRNDD